MKSEERHKLKTNELAESLSELPEFFREHGNKILIGAIVVLVVLLGGYWWRNAQANARQENIATLNNLLAQKNQLQMLSVQQAQMENPSDSKSLPYDATSLAGSFASLAKKTAGSPTGMIALLEQAESLRSQLLYSSRPITDEQRESLCRQAEGIYEQVKREYPNSSTAFGSANLGLALLAEERGQWEKAREIYNQIVAEGELKLAGTMFPVQAQMRLKMIDDISVPIEFPPPSLLPEEATDPLADAPAIEVPPTAEPEVEAETANTEAESAVEESSEIE